MSPDRESRLQEDLAMSDGEREPVSPGDEPGEGADHLDSAREAELIREVLRVQERHREGGVDAELDADDEEQGQDT
jgi:hypothetical protein